MEELINMTLLMILLGSCAYFDLKERKIPILPIALYAGSSIGISVYQHDFSMAEFLLSLTLGVCFCLLSILSKGALGMGDALLTMACGIGLGFYKTLALFFYGFLFSGLVGFLFLIGKKKNRKTEMPLVPFLYVVYGGMCFLGM